MMKYFTTTIILLLGLTLAASAQMRVGYMDPQVVLDNLPEKEAIERQLNRFLDSREAEFEEKAIELQNMLARFQQEAPNLSEEETRRRQQELQVRDRELEEFQMRVQRELEQRQAELLGPILQEMNIVIESLAAERNLDYVLNEATSEGEMFLLFISDDGKENLNLTDQVIARMLQ
ncbi:MAG: OmpH family outer membrane protein [Balneolaceae bacterium]|nr:MAG: OmpH family outer membrane protein [Balneolaceae bacterium]